MKTNAEVWELALQHLTPDELAGCFLAAFHKLPADHKDIVEDRALKVIATDPRLKPEDALELVAHTGIILATEVPLGQMQLFAL